VFLQSIKWLARKRLSADGYDNIIDIAYLNYWQGGCRTGMAKVTNAYDLPARFVYWPPFFPFQSQKSMHPFTTWEDECLYAITVYLLRLLSWRRETENLFKSVLLHSHATFDPFDFWLYILDGRCNCECMCISGHWQKHVFYFPMFWCVMLHKLY